MTKKIDPDFWLFLSVCYPNASVDVVRPDLAYSEFSDEFLYCLCDDGRKVVVRLFRSKIESLRRHASSIIGCVHLSPVPGYVIGDPLAYPRGQSCAVGVRILQNGVAEFSVSGMLRERPLSDFALVAPVKLDSLAETDIGHGWWMPDKVAEAAKRRDVFPPVTAEKLGRLLTSSPR